jgi:hypothetical protein
VRYRNLDLEDKYLARSSKINIINYSNRNCCMRREAQTKKWYQINICKYYKMFRTLSIVRILIITRKKSWSYSTDWASGRLCFYSPPTFNSMYWCSLDCFVAQISTSESIPVPRMCVRALEQFLLHFFLLALIDSTWSQVFI